MGLLFGRLRMLPPHDSILLSAAPSEVVGTGYRDVRELLTQAIAAAAIMDGAIVSSHTRVQEEGQKPVWSTGHFNTASMKIAQDIGFTEISRRTYVVADASRRAEVGSLNTHGE